ncbi:DUF6418 domain-containing protein [Priestia aryabhattai]
MNAYTILAYISLLVYLILGIHLYKKRTKYFIFIFLLYFYQLTAVVSNLYLEHGNVFITEQSIYSYGSGSTFRLVLYNLAFFLPLSYFLNKMDKVKHLKILSLKTKENSAYLTPFFLLLIVFSLLLLYANLFISGIPLFNDQINRYTFWENASKVGFAQKIHYQISVFGFILGILNSYSKKKKTKVLTVFLLIFSIIYLILFGEKFSSIFRTIYMFSIPFFTMKLITKKQFLSSRDYFKILLAIMLFLVLIFYNYSGKTESAFDLFINRAFALQGHTWWGADKYFVNHPDFNNFAQLKNEVSEITSPTENHEKTGMRFLMLLISPISLASQYITNNVNFTMAYPAILLFSFGKIGTLVFQILMALLTAIVIKTYRDAIVNKRIILGLLSTKIYISLFTLSYQGDFSDFFNLSTVLIIYIILFSYLISNVKSIRIKKIKDDNKLHTLHKYSNYVNKA